MVKSMRFSLLVGVIMFDPGTQSLADTYHGDLCWQANYGTEISWQAGDPSQSSPPTTSQAALRLGTYQKDGGHYALYGRVSGSTESTVYAAHGNAEANGDSILMTLVLGGVSSTDNPFSDIFTAVLNAQTLNGTFSAVGTHYTNSGQLGNSSKLGIHSGSGTLTLVTCP